MKKKNTRKFPRCNALAWKTLTNFLTGVQFCSFFGEGSPLSHTADTYTTSSSR